jgi:hypothetical protein
MPRPMPLVEPVTRAVLPLSMWFSENFDGWWLRSADYRRDPLPAHHDRTPPAPRAVPGCPRPAPHGLLGMGRPANPRVLVCVHGLSRQGRDFDTLAPTCAALPRGLPRRGGPRPVSDWLADPMGYAIPAYVADMVTLLARLDAETVDWVGTSMGGLIGLGWRRCRARRCAPGAQRRGAGDRAGGAAAHRHLPGHAGALATLDEAADALWAISQGFGPHTREQWLALTRPQLKPDGDGFKPHYDPAIAVPFRAITPEMAQAGQAMLWQPGTACAARRCCCAVPQSDLLSAATAQAMTAARPARPAGRVRRRRPRADAGAARPAPRWCGSSCARHEDRRRLAPRRGGADRAAGRQRPATAGRRRRGEADAARCSARAPLPSRCCRPALDTGEDALGMPTAWPPSCGHRRGAVDAGGGLPGLRRRLPAAPEEVVPRPSAPVYASLVAHTRKLVQIQRAAREAQVGAEQRALQTERVRKMLLAFSRDLRVVLLRLASRLQTLRWHAASKRPARRAGAGVAAGVRAAGQPAGHLADQVGAGGPGLPLPAARDYRRMARLLDEKRTEREPASRRPRANSGLLARPA